jgi:hypothetical protein
LKILSNEASVFTKATYRTLDNFVSKSKERGGGVMKNDPGKRNLSRRFGERLSFWNVE